MHVVQLVAFIGDIGHQVAVLVYDEGIHGHQLLLVLCRRADLLKSRGNERHIRIKEHVIYISFRCIVIGLVGFWEQIACK